MDSDWNVFLQQGLSIYLTYACTNSYFDSASINSNKFKV